VSAVGEYERVIRATIRNYITRDRAGCECECGCESGCACGCGCHRHLHRHRHRRCRCRYRCDRPGRRGANSGVGRDRAFSPTGGLGQISFAGGNHKGIAFQAPKGTNPLQLADGWAYLAAGEGPGEGEGEGEGEGPGRAGRPRTWGPYVTPSPWMDAWTHGCMDASIRARHWRAITASRRTGLPPAKGFAIQTSESGVPSSEFRVHPNASG
jgi:hypothetical protein